MKKLSPYFKGYGFSTFIAPAFKMLEAVFELLVPLIVADIIDVGIANGDMHYVWTRCGLMFLLAAVGLICSLTAQYNAAKSAIGVSTALRSDLIRHIADFSYTELDRIGTPTLVTRMANDVILVQNAINLTLRVALRVPCIVLGAVIMAATISLKLTGVYVAVVAVIVVALLLILRSSMRNFKNAQENLDTVTLKVRENISGARVVRAFSGQRTERKEFAGANHLVYAFQSAAGRTSAALSPVVLMVANLGIIVVLIAGGREVYNGILTQGQITALVNYMTQIFINVVRVTELIIVTSRGLAGWKRVKSVLEIPTSMEDVASCGASEVNASENDAETEPRYAVEFNNVSFTYMGAGDASLQNVNLKIRPGETIGIIGGTGSGKTTFANLICRFYDATEGEVRINGRDIKSYGLSELPSICGVVPQKATLFTGTIRDNMRFLNGEATDEEINEAISVAQGEFVNGLEAGLDTPVETAGKNFSGGQRQRLTIARALVAKPDILILDDSSSALDFATDAALRRELRHKLQDTTLFIISQRAATVSDADRILVLDEGMVNGFASHDELVETCDIYREICESQGLISGKEVRHG